MKLTKCNVSRETSMESSSETWYNSQAWKGEIIWEG